MATHSDTNLGGIEKILSSYSVHHPITHETIEREFSKPGHGCLHGIRFDVLNINAKTKKVAKGNFFFVAKTDSKPLKNEGDPIQKHLLIQCEIDEQDPLRFHGHILTSYSMTGNQSPLSVLLEGGC